MRSELEQAGNDEQAVHYLYRCLQLSAKQPELQRDLLVRLARSYDRSSTLSQDKATVIQWYYRAVGAAPGGPVLADCDWPSCFSRHSSSYWPRSRPKRCSAKGRQPACDAQRILALAKYGQLRRGRPVLAQQVLLRICRMPSGDSRRMSKLPKRWRMSIAKRRLPTSSLIRSRVPMPSWMRWCAMRPQNYRGLLGAAQATA